MNGPAPKFQEEYSAKLPAQALAARDNKRDEVVLRDVLRRELKKRRFTSDKAIDNLSCRADIYQTTCRMHVDGCPDMSNTVHNITATPLNNAQPWRFFYACSGARRA